MQISTILWFLLAGAAASSLAVGISDGSLRTIAIGAVVLAVFGVAGARPLQWHLGHLRWRGRQA
jgi:uncharacterized membrane protein YccC